MKTLTLEEWEEKYIAGEVAPFDQKNTMFNRWSWDPEIRPSLKDWRFLGTITDKPGYTMRELALRRASRVVGSEIILFNTSKPNSSRVTRMVSEAMREARKRAVLPGQTLSFDTKDLIPSEEEKMRYADRPGEVSRDIKKTALYFGADLVGICRLDRRWLYSHTYDGEGPVGGPGDAPVVTGEHKPQEVPPDFQYAVVMGFEEDYNMIKCAPSWIAHSATSMGYTRMAVTNMHLSAFIRSLGFKTIDCSTNDVALSIPMAMQAGLGELGRNGLLVTPKFGPRVRISKVLTDLPLVPDSPIEFGVTAFCDACQKCADTCPSQSIIHGKRTTESHNVSNAEGQLKWPINAEGCRAYWGRMNRPCTTCIASCPYNKPDTRFHRTVRWFADHVRWADRFYVKMDDVFGYGKPGDPAEFWDTWKPRSH
ncbi:MAG: reductive dehalogenase [Deltaproteobacteria bacterium]|nr:reductive dehalogenase [Deltaproteobacteria bacterium]